MDALHIVQQHLIALAHTAATRELDKHMALYSRNVDLYGVPGHDVLGFDEIAVRRRNEFDRGLLLRIAYSAPEILAAQRGSIAYRVQEIMKCTSGSTLVLDKVVTLNEEPDSRWRIRSERITHARTAMPKYEETSE